MSAELVQVPRSQYLGGSDVAAVLGISKWKTPLRLFLEKTGQVPDEPVTEQKRKLFERGHRWEPIALEMLLDVLEVRGHAVHLLERNQRYIDPEFPFLACEIDAEIMLDGEHTNVELKTVHPFAAKDWGEMDTDEVPIYYNAQATHGLGVTGRRLCIVGCLIGADDMTPYRVERDEETIAAVRAKCVQFWREHVLTGIPPDPIDFGDLRALFAKDNGKEIELPGLADKVALLAEIKGRIKEYEKDAAGLEFEIQDAMRDAAVLTCEGRPLCTWKTQITSRFDQKAFAAAHPDLFAEFKRASESRVFRLKGTQ